MSTLKMLRELRRQLGAEGCTFTVEMTRRAHPKLTVTHPNGSTQLLVVSSTPQDEYNQVEDAVRAVRRFAKGLHGKHPLEAKQAPEV